MQQRLRALFIALVILLSLCLATSVFGQQVEDNGQVNAQQQQPDAPVPPSPPQQGAPIPQQISPEENRRKEKAERKRKAAEADVDILFVDIKRFDETISQDYFLVFFGATWCKHCQDFTPKWLEFQKAHREELAAKNLHIGKVECTLDGGKELCEGRFKIDAYPSLKLFHNGQFVDEFMNELEADKVYEFCLEQLKGGSDNTLVDKWVKLKEERRKKAEAESASQGGKVVELTQASFDRYLSTGPAFIKFFAPWCGHCQQLAPTWEKLATVVSGNIHIASVDCTIEGELCKKFKVDAYPTLKYFQGDPPTSAIEYRGPRTLENLQTFAEGMIMTDFTPISAKALKAELAKQDVAIVLAFHAGKSKQEDVFATLLALSPFVHNIPVYLVPEPGFHRETFSAFSLLPSTKTSALTSESMVLLLSKNNHKSQVIYEFSLSPFWTPVTATSPSSERDTAITQLKTWVNDNKRPIIEELNEMTSKEILSTNGLAVLLMTESPTSPAIEALKRAAGVVDSGKFKVPHNVFTTRKDSQSIQIGKHEGDVLFVWIDGIRFFKYLQRVYNYQRGSTRFVIAHPSNDEYFDEHDGGKKWEVTEQGVLEAVKEVMTGQGKSLSTDGVLGRMVKTVSKSVSYVGTQVIERPLITLLVFIALAGVAFWLMVARVDSHRYIQVKKE